LGVASDAFPRVTVSRAIDVAFKTIACTGQTVTYRIIEVSRGEFWEARDGEVAIDR
jgi:hypothetical protein